MEESKIQGKNMPTDEQIKKWSEGNSHLEAMLVACRENDIPSMYCCAGHGMFDEAYLTIKMNDKIASKIYGIINAISGLRNVEFRIAQEEFGFKSSFTVYIKGNKSKRNQVMDIIAATIGKESELEQLPINLQKVIKISQILKQNQSAFDLLYTNGRRKMLMLENLRFVNENVLDKKSLATIGFKANSQNPYTKNTQYVISGITEGATEQKVLNRVINGINSVLKIDQDVQPSEDIPSKKGTLQKIREFFGNITVKSSRLLPAGEKITVPEENSQTRRKKFVEQLKEHGTTDKFSKSEGDAIKTSEVGLQHKDSDSVNQQEV